MKKIWFYTLMMFLVVGLTNCSKPSDQSDISSDFPFESKYVDVLDSKMHYVEVGVGDPILFLHGNPTSSYLWRNIMPHVQPHGRAIAVDLIGMGKSDKPDIDYTFVDHAKYLDAFIQQLNLKNITLVVHDWGSGLGFNYAARNEANIKGIAFMEAIWQSPSYKQGTLIEQLVFKAMRHPKLGPKLIIEKNMFITKILPMSIIRKLSEIEQEWYARPYPTQASRKPVLVWPNEIPFDGEPKVVNDIIINYHNFLKTTDLPKLLFWVKPGMIIKEPAVDNMKQSFKNLDIVYLGKGKHYIQEDHPHKIGKAIAEWYQQLQKQ